LGQSDVIIKCRLIDDCTSEQLHPLEEFNSLQLKSLSAQAGESLLNRFLDNKNLLIEHDDRRTHKKRDERERTFENVSTSLSRIFAVSGFGLLARSRSAMSFSASLSVRLDSLDKA
jgi:hypothetical protein